MIKHRKAPPIRYDGDLPPFPRNVRPQPGDWTKCPWYDPLWARLHGRRYPTNVVLWGGRAGGKTWALAEYGVRLLQLLPANTQVVAFREIKERMKASIQATVHDVIQTLGWADRFDAKGTETYCRTSGATLRYMGLNPSAPHSIDNVKGLRNVQLALIDEAQFISERGLQIMLDTVVREDESQVVVAMNPEDPTSAAQRIFLGGSPPQSSYVLRVNWDSNPWFTYGSEKRRRDAKERHGEAYYRHLWEGEPKPADTMGAVVDVAGLEAARLLWTRRPDPTGFPLRVGVDLGVQGHMSTAVAYMHHGALLDVRLHAPNDWSSFAEQLVANATAIRDEHRCAGIDVAYDAAGDQAASFVRALWNVVGEPPSQYDRDVAEWEGRSVDPEIMAIPVAFGGEVAGKKKPWDRGVTNAAVFASRGAQLSALFGQRVLNAKWAAAGGDVDPESAFQISPSCADVDGFMRECTTPRWKRTGLGKRQLDKAPGGADSPHRYDAVVLAMQADSAYGLSAEDWSGRQDAQEAPSRAA